jgi:O-acetyl-ADP-ribose deacetylase (regulator of RNase III)
MNLQILQGDLLDQDVDVIVNVWNRNTIPWRLLPPQGFSAAIRQRGGTAPFKELRKNGSIPLGGAVLTSAGQLPFKGLIHVAANRMYWASEWSIRQSVRNAMTLAHEKGFQSIAFPLIGVGDTGFRPEQATAIMEDELGKMDSPIEVRLVFKKAKKQMPWWYYGVQVIFICLLLAQSDWQRRDYFHYLFMGTCLLLVLVTFIHQFIKQQAQYTIKTMMIATVVVAVFCSIYRCFGFHTVYFLILILYVIILLCAGRWAKEGESKG